MAEVLIRDHRFVPAVLTVPAGTVVRWTNAEKRTAHSVLWPGRPGETAQESERLFPGEQVERRYDLPGRYPYRCGPHPDMQGEVQVLPASTPPPEPPARLPAR